MDTALQDMFKIGIAASIGLAFITNLILYIALRSENITVSMMKSAKPGYLENLYRQTPALKSFFLSFVAVVCTLSKVLVILVGIGLVVVSSMSR